MIQLALDPWRIHAGPGEEASLQGARADLERLVRLILGIEVDPRAVVRLQRTDVARATDRDLRRLRSRVAVCWDGARLVSHLSVLENLALPSRYHRHEADGPLRARCEATLADHGRSALLHRPTWDLTPSERHDVVWMRAAVQRPVAMLYQPTGSRVELGVIRSLRGAGCATVRLEVV
jgi:ABC-type ATPase involved in cell division